eukprot:1779101-Amphidinium_carterae.1
MEGQRPITSCLPCHLVQDNANHRHLEGLELLEFRSAVTEFWAGQFWAIVSESQEQIHRQASKKWVASHDIELQYRQEDQHFQSCEGRVATARGTSTKVGIQLISGEVAPHAAMTCLHTDTQIYA